MSSGGGIGRLLRQLGSNDWLGRLLDASSKQASPERWNTPDYTIHPSGCGNPCALSIELGMLGHRGAIKSRNRDRMDNGTDSHKRWARKLEKAGVLLAAEWNIRLADPVTNGTLDAIVQNPATGDIWMIEFKTTNERHFQELGKPTVDPLKNGAVLYKWHREWYLQFIYYLSHADYNGRQLTGGFFIVENTNTQDYVIFEAKPTPEHIAEAERNAVAAQRAVAGGELIQPRPFQRGDQACRWCDHVAICGLLEEGDGDVWALMTSQFKKMNLTLKTKPLRPAGGPGG